MTERLRFRARRVWRAASGTAHPTGPLRILFSSARPQWEEQIRGSFEGSGHELEFGEFLPAHRHDWDLVVPMTIEELRFLDQVRPLVSGNPIPIPRFEVVSLCDDKARLRRFLADSGFAAHFPGDAGPRDIPFILKKRIDEWSANCHLIRNEVDARIHAGKIGDPAYIREHWIPGDREFASHVVIRDGRIRAALNIEYQFAGIDAIKGRDDAISLRPCRLPHVRLFERILNTIGFEGLCCLNYKESGGVPKLLEINPRFGGSLAPHFQSFLAGLR